MTARQAISFDLALVNLFDGVPIMGGELPRLEMVTITFAAVLIATMIVATLTHRALRVARTIAEGGGVDSLLSYRSASFLFIHFCLLFSWFLFLRACYDAVEHAEPLELTIGMGVFLGGQAAMAFRAAAPTNTDGGETSDR